MSDYTCRPGAHPPHDDFYAALNHSHGGGGGQAFPVGSVFLAVVATDPATLLGYGTWARIAEGQFLVGLKATDTDFDVAEETGGAKTATPSAHSGAAVGDHAALVHSGGAVNAHTTTSKTTTGSGTTLLTGPASHTVTQPANHAAQVHTVTQPAAHAALSIVPPYFVVYLWKRTA